MSDQIAIPTKIGNGTWECHQNLLNRLLEPISPSIDLPNIDKTDLAELYEIRYVFARAISLAFQARQVRPEVKSKIQPRSFGFLAHYAPHYFKSTAF